MSEVGEFLRRPQSGLISYSHLHNWLPEIATPVTKELLVCDGHVLGWKLRDDGNAGEVKTTTLRELIE